MKKIFSILAIVLVFLFPCTTMAGTIENGWYTIQTKNSALNRLSVNDSKQNTKSIIETANNVSGQKFLFSEISNNVYKIGTGTTVGTYVLGTNGLQQKYTGAITQKWKVIKYTDNSYSFVNESTGKYLTYDNKNNISETVYNNNNYQKFNLIKYTEKFTVTFHDGYSGIINRQSIEKGKNAIAPTNPTRAGYIFAGWDKTFTNINSNITVTAKWTPKTVKITFHYNANGNDKLYAETYTYGKSGQSFGITLKEEDRTGQFGKWDREGYELLGWSLDKNATSKTWDIYSGVTNNWINTYSDNVDVYAVWKNESSIATDIKDGWYVIKPTLNQNYAIDVVSNKPENKTNIQLYQVNGADAQKFYIHKIDNDTWNIMTGTPGYLGSLDIVDGKAQGNLQQYQYANVNAQKWKIIKNTDGSYTFYNKATGNVLDMEGDDNIFNGKNLWDYPYLNGTDKGQSFTLTPTSEPESVSGKKKLVFKDSNQVVNISSGSVLEGASAITYFNEELNNAKFAFEKVADGTYHIRSLVSDRYLFDNGTKVIQSRGSSNNFKWQTVWNGDGSVSFKNVGTGKFLYASSTNNCTQITTTNSNNDNKAKFTLPTTDYTQVIANGTYMIKSGSGMYLTTEYNNWNNGTKIAGAKTYTDPKKGMRLFRVTYLGNGNYRFETGSSIYKSSIDMPNNVDTAGTQPQQYTNNNATAQKFHILGLGNGNFRISHGAAMNIQTTTDTDPCVMQATSDNAAQKMTFTKSGGWLIQDTFKYYFSETGTKPQIGIDVSKWQGNIDWAKVKAIGRVDFAIIRVLDHSTTSTTGVDAYAEKNIKGCEANGIPYGVYWYSLATNTTQLKSELDRVWNAIGSYKPTKGIWYDIEDVSSYASAWGSSWQSNGTGKTNLTNMINYAKSNIESHGFEAGLYLNKSQITCIDPTTFGIKWWTPRYFTNTNSDTNLLDLSSATYKGTYMWQWSDTYTLNGINDSRVDFDCVLYDDEYVYQNGNLIKKNNNVTTNTATNTTTNSSTTGKNGWIQENNNWYYYKNDAKYTGWHKMGSAEGETTEHYSYFDNNGKLVTGWFTADSGYENLRYADKNGWVYGPCGFKTNIATTPNVGVTVYDTGATGTLNGSYYFNSNGELIKVLYEDFIHLNQRSYFATDSTNYGNACGPVSALMAANMMGKLKNYIGSTYTTATQTASARYAASASFRSYMTTWQESTGVTNVGRTGGSGVYNYQIKNNLLYWHNVNSEYMEDDNMYSSDRLRGILTWGRVSIPFCNVKLDGSYAKHFMVVNGWRLENGDVQYHVVDPYGKTKLDPNCEGQNDGWYSVNKMNSITYKGSGKTSTYDSVRAVRNFTTVGTRMKFGY